MGLPAGYRLRAPALGDLDAVAGVLIADGLDEAGQVVLGVDFLRAEWSRAGFNLAADAWVVVDGAGVIVGYVQARPEESSLVECWGVVHPGHRGRGVGAALLRRSFATFTGRGVRHVILNVDAENTTGATALYERAGMRVINQWDLWERLPGNLPR